jgi:hypothetical protein
MNKEFDYCSLCYNVLDINKKNKSTTKQIIEFKNPKIFIEYFNDKKKIDKNIEYKIDFDRKTLELNEKSNQNLLKIYDELYVNNIDYYNLKCIDCNSQYELKPGSVIYENKNNNFVDLGNLKSINSLINNPILPITKDYICINKDCKSNKDFSLKNAKMYKIRDTHILYYICLCCKYYWPIGNM